jgi:NADP-dependent 3-hydroxy acid dehydrogenase YdfG
MTETKTALITGTSSGIGNETAKLFQSRGWRVVATARDPQRAQNLAGIPNVLLTQLDVTDVKTIESAVGKALERFERIDVLVNNAGYGSYGPLETYTSEKMRKQSTNVLGLLEMTKAVIPSMRTHHSSVIINLSSVGGKGGLSSPRCITAPSLLWKEFRKR